MDVVQLTTHIDATAVREAVALPGSFATREARDRVAAQVREQLTQALALVLFDGPEHATYAFTEGSVRIGRSITADIQLEDPGVSRKHAVVERAGSHVRVLDDRSLNGVMVNGQPVALQCALADDDELQIGPFVLRVIIND